MEKTKVKSRGITLISLVITIIVLLILAGVSIAMLTGENGIIRKAQDATETYKTAEEKDISDLDNMNKLIEKYNKKPGSVTNPYDEDKWVYAWAYEDGDWGEMLTKADGDVAEGQFIAKFYSTGENVTIPEEFAEKGLEDGPEYHLVLEGNGTINMTELSGWIEQAMQFQDGETVDCIIAYVTEVFICDGIENVPMMFGYMGVNLKKINISNTVTVIEEYAFDMCASLEKITIPSSVKRIGDMAFVYCTNLSNVTFEDGLTEIGMQVFIYCTKLESVILPNTLESIGNICFGYCANLKKVVIPDSVTEIKQAAFTECYNLKEIKFYTTNADDITFGIPIFMSLGGNYTLPENSKIYVLNEGMKTKIEELNLCDTTVTTIEVVSKDTMESI